MLNPSGTIAKAPFGSRGGTVVDDGSHNTTPFGSMHCCGWGWKESGSWVNSASPQRWRESCTVEWECQVIHMNLQCCPCFCDGIKKNCGLHACHMKPWDSWLGSGIVWPCVKLWKVSECNGWGRWVWNETGYITRSMKVVPPFTEKQRKRAIRECSVVWLERFVSHHSLC